MNPGRFEHYQPFYFKLVTPRPVDVWLPDAVKLNTKERYPVIYMHDGQNLFDPETSFLPGIDWGMADTAHRLIQENRIPPVIIVGIWSATARGREYGPAKAVNDYASSAERKKYLRDFGKPVSDDYLRSIVNELKPFIDRTFPTRTDAAGTAIMGSSFGGLISLYAVCEYPEVFGGAGCLSTHWPAAGGATIPYLADSLPDPETHRIYFDYGTETLDAQYEPYQVRADAVMRRGNFQEGVNWVTKKFPGEEHSERAWRKRVHIPLRFLLSQEFAD